jgi:DNA ligase (NAD+)
MNKKCFAVEKENIIHFVSKKGFNIEGLGERIVEQLMNVGLVSNVADIFELEKGDLEPLERFAEKSADNLIESIENSKKIELSKFLFSLGIRFVGEGTAILISDNMHEILDGKIKNLADIISAFSKTKKEDWIKIKGIGEKSAESMEEWFGNSENIKMLKRMEEFGIEIIVPDAKHQTQNTKLQGKTFVLTGELKDFTRDALKDMIRKAGGNVSSSVSRKTDYLLVGAMPGSKYVKAKELGVKIIEEEEFKNLLK